jgi:hypothetical protein
MADCCRDVVARGLLGSARTPPSRIGVRQVLVSDAADDVTRGDTVAAQGTRLEALCTANSAFPAPGGGIEPIRCGDG